MTIPSHRGIPGPHPAEMSPPAFNQRPASRGPGGSRRRDFPDNNPHMILTTHGHTIRSTYGPGVARIMPPHENRPGTKVPDEVLPVPGRGDQSRPDRLLPPPHRDRRRRLLPRW